MKAFARIERLERLLHRRVRGMRYIMPDGRWCVLPYNHRGFYHAVQGIDSSESRIVLSSRTDSNHGAMLNLLHAVLNPVDTSPVEEPVEDSNVIVTA